MVGLTHDVMNFIHSNVSIQCIITTWHCLEVSMDPVEFRSSTYQRVLQYISRFDAGSDLNIFSYKEGNVEGSVENCLESLIKYKRTQTLVSI